MESKKIICRCLADISAKPTAHGIGLKSVLLANDETDSNVTQIAKTILRKGETVEIHVHKTMDEHYLFLGGKGVFSVDGNDIECREGLYLLIPAGTPHGMSAESDVQFLTIGVALNG